MSNLTEIRELKDTIELMTSDDYKERLIAEYYQLLIRFRKLGNILDNYYEFSEERKQNFDCPFELLQMQFLTMSKLLDILKIHAIIEGVTL